MNPEEAKEYAKTNLEAYLNAKGINTSSNFSCLNPAHEDKHPSMSFDSRRNRCHCFSCGVDYDIFDVVAIDTGLSGKELFNHVYSLYNISVDYENSKNPWFISYSDEKWQNVTQNDYNERKKIFESYKRFDFIPFNNDKLNKILEDRYDINKDYFDYSVVLEEFPKNYYYTTVKINKSKERILIITDEITKSKNSYHGLFYYIAKNSFVYPLGYLESTKPLSQSKNYLYINNGNENIKFYMSDKNLGIIKSSINVVEKDNKNIEFETIKSADKFIGDFGSAAGDDIKKVMLDGYYFEYHKSQYKKGYIKNLMQECIIDGVKTQVQMYCCVVKKLHP